MRRMPVVLCGLLIAAILLTTAPAIAQGATREEVFAALGVDAFPGDLVVLVDTSGSMRTDDLYGQVTAALGPLLDTVEPVDHVALLTFDSTVTARFSGQVAPDGASPTAQLPATPEGTATDIGRAIAAGIEELERPDRSDVGTLLVLTDGIHEPPDDSQFPDTTGASWDQLRDRASALTDRQFIRSYAIALTETTDAALLNQVFPAATVVGLPAEQLVDYFERVRVQARLDKAVTLVEPDLHADIEVTWPADIQVGEDPTTVQVALTSTSQFMPVTISDLQLTTGSDSGSFTAEGLPDAVQLAPGETQTIDLDVAWTPPTGFAFGRQEATATGDLGLEGTVTTAWSDVLADDLELAPDLQLSSAPTQAQLTGEIGVGWPTILAILAIVLLMLGFVLFKFLTRHPRLRGNLTIRADGQPPKTVRLGGRSLKLGSKQGLAGKGAVRGRESSQPQRGGGAKGRGGKKVDLILTYGHQQKAATRTIPPNGSTNIEGVTFQYQTTRGR